MKHCTLLERLRMLVSLQSFGLHPDGVPSPVVPFQISTPFCAAPLLDLVQTATNCLDNNFLSFLVIMVGGIVVFHYQTILNIQDECCLILGYSTDSGTGIFIFSFGVALPKINSDFI